MPWVRSDGIAPFCSRFAWILRLDPKAKGLRLIYLHLGVGLNELRFVSSPFGIASLVSSRGSWFDSGTID